MIFLFVISLILIIYLSLKRGILTGILRGISIGLLLFALLNESIKENDRKIPGFVALIDVSESVDREFLKSGKKWLSEFEVSKTLYFGEETFTDESSVNKKSTDIESAIKEASKIGDKILLVSDGFETTGNALNINFDSKIYPYLEESSNLSQKTYISYVKSPHVVEEGESPQIFITVSNHTKNQNNLSLKIKDESKEVSEDLSINSDSDSSLSKSLDPIKTDKREVSLTLLENNEIIDSKNLIIYPRKRENILCISSSQSEPSLLKDINKELFFPINYIEPEKVTDEIIKSSKIIILNNIKKDSLSTKIQNSIEEKISNGGSLYFFGGNTAYGLGNWIGTNFEKLFPVKLLPPESKQKRANVAVSLVLDRSQSMREESRLESAKQAAVEVISSLKDDDYVGVMGFDKSPFPVIPLTRLQGNREKAIDRLKILRPWGKTDPLLAINLAREELEKAQAARKHIIFLTDGELPYGGPTYTELVKQLRFSGITFSTVLIGQEFDSLMREMARVGGGTFYNTSDPTTLPRIFMRDIYVKSGEETLKEDSQFKIEKRKNIEETISLNDFPNILGFNQNEILPQANTELVISTQGRNYPFYAWMPYGKGKTHALTSDISGRWTSAWGTWSKKAQFFSELFGGTLSDSNSQLTFDFSYLVKGEKIKFEFVTYGKNIPENLNVKVSNSNKETTLSLLKEAKGRFSGELEALPGEYTIELLQDSSRVGFSVKKEEIGEQKGQGINKNFLRLLAQKSGGALTIPRENSNPMEQVSSIKISPFILVFVSLFIWLLEIYLREVRRKH